MKKKIYVFSAEKYVKSALEVGAEVDKKWAIQNDGAMVKMNESIGMGTVDGEIVFSNACKYLGFADVFEDEKETELESALFAFAESNAELIEDLCLEIKNKEKTINEHKKAIDSRNEVIEKLLTSMEKTIDMIHKHTNPSNEKIFDKLVDELLDGITKALMCSGKNLQK